MQTLRNSHDTASVQKIRQQDSQNENQKTFEDIEFFIESNCNQEISTFEFNIFSFSQKVERNMLLPSMAFLLMKQNDFLNKIDKYKFLNFTREISSMYKKNVAYHNDIHGSDVAQHCNFIIKHQGLGQIIQFEDFDVISILIAALCHDVGHDGYNNQYHVKAKSNLYQLYGESSVQERLHSEITLKMLDQEQFDFLSSFFQPDQIKLIKKRILGSILSTDMAFMTSLREQFQNHLANTQGKSEDFIDRSSDESIEKSKQLISNVVLHACDISTSLRDFEVSSKWTELLFEEFFSQGDLEKSQQLQVSFLCDRDTTNISSGQEGFIQFVVLPIFKQISNICPAIIDIQINQGNQNIIKWKQRAEKEKEEKLLQ